MNSIYTGRIYNWQGIQRRVPDARLVSVMRYNWRYCPRHIERISSLGPPVWLLQRHRALDWNKSPDWREDRDQTVLAEEQQDYTREYIEHLTNDTRAKEGLERLREILGKMDIVLLCHERPGMFCHRHILSTFLKEREGYNTGGEIHVI